MNPDEKSKKKTRQQLRQKVMMLCYQMAALRNKRQKLLLDCILLVLVHQQLELIQLMGISVTYKTVYNKKKIVAAHEQTVQK